MLIPSKTNEAAVFSKPCGIVFLTLGAVIFSVSGGLVYMKSQVLISSCHRAVKLLDNPELVKKYYGSDDKEWAGICLSKKGNGDISNFLKDPNDVLEFKKPISILRAFSSNLTELNHTVSDFEPPGLFSYSLAVEAFTNYMLPDHMNEKRNGGYTDAIDTINTYTVHKYEDRYVLNSNHCFSGEIQISDLAEYHKLVNKNSEVKIHHCILLNKLDISSLKPELRYEDSSFASMISSFLSHLATCKPEIDAFLEKWSDNLLASRVRTHVLFDIFNQTKSTVTKIKQ
jgi:hypothetical protein